MSKHCLIIHHDKPIPTGIHEPRRSAIEQRRKEYRLKHAVSGPSVNVCVDSFDSDEDLSWLEQLQRDPNYKQSSVDGLQQ